MSFEGRGATIAILVLAGLLMVLGGFAGYGWIKERDARIQTEAQSKEQQRSIEELKSQQQQVQDSLTKQLAALEQEKKQPVTPAQFVADTEKLVTDLPKPLEVRLTPVNAEFPAGPQTQEVVIPQEDLRSLRDAQLTCEQTAAKLSACTQQVTIETEQLRITEKQRDEWKTAARGGSRWQRAMKAAKWFAIGAGAGYAGYAIAHH